MSRAAGELADAEGRAGEVRAAPSRCVCGCADPRGAAAHAIAAALAIDDLDRAIADGLLREDFESVLACARCTPACARASSEAREARLRALAARERHRARERRLQRRADERAAQRAPACAGDHLISAAPIDTGAIDAGAIDAAAVDAAAVAAAAIETTGRIDDTLGNAPGEPPSPPRPALPSAAAAALARAKAKAAQRGPS